MDEHEIRCAWCGHAIYGAYRGHEDGVVICQSCHTLRCDAEAGPLTIDTFEVEAPRADVWPLPWSGPRRVRCDPPLVVSFRVLTQRPDDDADADWELPCMLGEFDPGVGEALERTDFPYPIDYSERTGGTREDIVTAICAHLGFHFLCTLSDSLDDKEDERPSKGAHMATAATELARRWNRLHLIDE